MDGNRELFPAVHLPISVANLLRSQLALGLLLLSADALGAPSTNGPVAVNLNIPSFNLRATNTWRLNAPGGIRMDSSGLMALPDGRILTVNDRDGTVYSMRPDPAKITADLTREPTIFSREALSRFAYRKHGHYDGEGLGRDALGRIYMCEEADRWILRCDPGTGAVELLEIDWSPAAQWFGSNRNASFEGIAIDGDRLWVANERQKGRIILVDLPTLKVADSFQAQPIGSQSDDVHYSDLCFFDGALWVLCRDSFCILKVDPITHATLVQLNYRNLERSAADAYAQPFNLGFAEGLIVDQNSVWIVVDNNGFPRVAALNDRRPTLWRCPRPDLASDQQGRVAKIPHQGEGGKMPPLNTPSISR